MPPNTCRSPIALALATHSSAPPSLVNLQMTCAPSPMLKSGVAKPAPVITPPANPATVPQLGGWIGAQAPSANGSSTDEATSAEQLVGSTFRHSQLASYPVRSVP